MIINNNLLIANDGYLLSRVDTHEIVGKQYLCGYVYYNKSGEKLPVPYLESSVDFTEVEESEGYGEVVTKLIRDKYSLSSELAIQRQRDTKQQEFEEYFNYCEECKKLAKEKLGL